MEGIGGTGGIGSHFPYIHYIPYLPYFIAILNTLNQHLSFSAHTVPGSGRGKTLGVPTINLDLADVPTAMEEGIYACRVTIEDRIYPAALHYGPRPVFGDTPSCEVHLIDAGAGLAELTMTQVEIEIIERVRPVQDFDSPHALIEQMLRDIAACRAILATHGNHSDHQKTDS